MKLNYILFTPARSWEEQLAGTGLNKRDSVEQGIKCADGAMLSVQASEGHYCKPRNNQGPWHQVEVGFPDPKPEGWEAYSNSEDIYSCVPVELVKKYILLHGGEM